VLAVTENQRIVRSAEGKPTLWEQVVRTGHEAVIIYVAARISTVRELRFEKRQTLRQASRGCRIPQQRHWDRPFGNVCRAARLRPGSPTVSWCRLTYVTRKG